jgi:hypothetical protein
VILFVAISLNVYGQIITNPQSDTIRWSTSSLTDLNANVTVAHTCQFITYGSQKLDWVQDNGNFTTKWTITNTTGSWSDASLPGSITFAISSEQQGTQLAGQITLNRSSSGLSVILKISGGPSDVNLSYQISSNEKL